MLDIRPARRHDATVLATLSGELGYPVDPDRLVPRLLRLIEARDHEILVAEVDGDVVGWVHVLSADRLESGSFAELGGLVVSERYRRDGIGRALVRAAEGWARDRGLARLRVRTNVVRSGAHRFYEALGFDESKRQAVFTRELGSGSG